MKQTLSMKLGQQLKMTPQLQQAIRLLQLSSMELSQEIQLALDSNPMLEAEDDYQQEDIDSDLADGDYDPPAEDGTESLDDFAEDIESEVNEQLQEPLSEAMPSDSTWDDIYPQSGSSGNLDSDFDPNANNSAAEGLTDHLLWQLNLTPMAPSDKAIAYIILDSIDDNGMLVATVDEICASLADPNLSTDEQVTADDVEWVLQKIQQFDPIGVGARDVRECLLLQLAQLDAATPWLEHARDLVSNHLDLLEQKDFTALVRQTHLSESDLSQVVALIRTLQPRPGAAISEAQSDFVLPDVVVRKHNGLWQVELNPATLPKVRLNSVYAGWVNTAKESADRDFMRNNLQEARWFLKSLQTRHDTLLKVATQIVEVQQAFFEHGPEAMKPLILADIAQQVDLHESTISRVTNRKYLVSPRGLFELKYFFSSHVGTQSGGEVSSTAIRALIQKLTADENPRKPLSDNKIATLLKEQNINVARRTVAKYRESLSIPPSNERKQLV
ncbi:MAG: RNA polymerase factor sigma-54 [Pseudomonadota bacterium]|nr:RNA polymerase factor sigma-54 [Pseudomonadota bacterium]MED5348614.1 RNA polymerase factor sigma-54 [Pseudomonadota bacterium]